MEYMVQQKINFSQRIQELRDSSPLDIPSKLVEFELHDKDSAYEVFDKLSEQFQKEDLIDNIVNPSICTIVDGVLAMPCFKGATRKMGLSAQRIINECKTFNYDASLSYLMPDTQTEMRNFNDYATSWAQDNRNNYDRKKYENTSEMGRYKAQRIKENGGRVNMEDEYRLTRDISGSRAGSDKRRNDPQNTHVAETDHIIPLKTIFEEVQSNAGLSDDDIRRIANQSGNFAVTGRLVNNPKRDMSNSEFIAEQDRLKAEGKPYVELNSEQRDNMIRMEQEAQSVIDNSINDTVLKNLSGRGHSDRAAKKALIEKKEKELGRKVTKEEQDEIELQCAREKSAQIYGEVTGQAAKQGLMYAMGNAVLLIIKPLYFELKDGFTNGFQSGVMATSAKEAFKIRFARIRDYVWKQLTSIKTYLGNAIEFVKNFISSLIEGLLNMFVGLFKQILRVVKEGIKLVMQASSVLFGEASRNLTAAEKGDAIVRMIGGSIAAFCGIAIEALLKDLPEGVRGVVSTLVSGLAGILVFYAIDKADLFNAKAERRNERIREVFDLRINEINERVSTLTETTCEAIKESSIKVASFLANITAASENNDYSMIGEQTGHIYEYLFGKQVPARQAGRKWDC